MSPFVRAALLSLVLGGSLAPWSLAEGGEGVVVETIPAGNSLAKAGLRAGDVLFAWERLPGPPATRGELSSPFDWDWMATEQAMRGDLQLRGERGGKPLAWSVPLGDLEDAEVRPVLPPVWAEIYERGRDHLEHQQIAQAIDCWRWLAEQLRKEGDWRRASWLLLRVGRVLGDRRAWDEGETALRDALALARDLRSQVLIFEWLGDLYVRQGRPAEAEQTYLAELRRKTAAWGESLEAAQAEFQLGWALYRQGRVEAARVVFEDSLATRRKLAPGSRAVSVSLRYLAIVARDRGDLEAAEQNLREALQVEGPLHLAGGSSVGALNNLGIVHSGRGDLDVAEDYLRQALEQALRSHTEDRILILILTNLGEVARARGDFGEAEHRYSEALALAERLPADLLEAAQPRLCLALLANDRGDLKAAEARFREAQKILKPLAPTSLLYLQTLLGLAAVSAGRGDLREAESGLREALELSQKLAPRGVQTAEALYLLAGVRRREGASAEAQTLLAHAVETLDSQIGQLGGSPEDKGAFRAEEGEIYRDAVRGGIEMGKPREAFQLLERFRAQAFLALLKERELTFASDIPPALDRERRRLATLYDGNELRLATLDPGREAASREALESEQRHLRKEREEIDAEIHRAAPRLAAMLHPRTLSFEEVRAALDPGTVMLSYSVGKEETQLFLVAPGRDLAVKTLPIGEEALRREVTQLRRQIEQAQSRSSLGTAGLEWASRHLYRTLVQPAEPWIAAGSRILIVPDGPLHLLPFAALIRDPRETGSGRGFQYLIEWKPLHTALSGTVYAELQARRHPSDEAPGSAQWVGFGDPWFPPRLAAGQETGETRLRSFSTRAGLLWRRLPESRREVEAVARLFPAPARQVYVDREATEERVKALGREARIVHFATHGFVDDRSPFDSGLVLAIPEQFTPGRENGLLQVWEIFESVRLDADLVVLSACETGLGEIRGGEGIIGLTRAFQYAGARSVLASLWRVDDRATADLMERFYRHLRAGEPKDEALRAAQLDLLARPGAAGAAPYFWASMQIYGDWR